MNDTASWYAAPLLAVFAAALALAVSQAVARLAIARRWLPDEPNLRSSHQRTTPRSGGVAIFAAWLAGVGAVSGLGGDPTLVRDGALLAPLVAMVFAVGLVDDILALRALWKFLGQAAAAVLFVWLAGPLKMAPLPILGDVLLGPAAGPVTVLWIVAFMNVFNFMDGVNGIAAACAAFAMFALCVAGVYFSTGLWAVSAGVAAAALVGFLPFNFPNGRLFMGDNGSQMVGFLIAATAVGAANSSGGNLSILFAPVVTAPFIVDVAFTLAHRAIRRRNVLTAHREHVYQLLLRSGLSHGAVTAIYLGLTAISTAVAIAMLRLEPDMQWLAPVLLISAFSIPAALIVASAKRRGLLSDDRQTDHYFTPPVAEELVRAKVPQAAE